MITNGTHPPYADTTGSEKVLYRYIQSLMIQGNTFNDEDELRLIFDREQFNIRGNNETSEFDLYWKVEIKGMEMESTHEAHDRIHAADYF